MPEEEDAGEEKLRASQEQYAKAVEAERMIKLLARQMLDGDAYERLMNIRLANPDLYAQLVQVLYGLYKQGQLRTKVSEAQLKTLVERLRQPRRETKIVRR